MPTEPLTQADVKIPAAQYVRMSTEHQQYSTENQSDVIREYAQRRGFEIIQTYADDGKSGLRIEGRDSLKRLIDDVENKRAQFQAILVYDVSRWGRFQDADESAYYEYICKRAGIQIYYCAEQFENDGSLGTTIIKSMKRAMAGEYSRELSSKVFKGQCKLIQLGYRQGGTAGYGLRRMLVDQNGNAKGLLKRGEHKSLQTDRVILVPGPDDEIAVIREIYRRFVDDSQREGQIAQWLGTQGIANEIGSAWTRGMVHEVLTNEKYIGNNVYNHMSFKLKKKRVNNPPDMWVRADGVFRAVVDPAVFFMARGIIQERCRVVSNEDMIGKLKNLYQQHRQLSDYLIDNTDGMPASSGYRYRFGSLIQAYYLAGYEPDHDYNFIQINKQLRALYPQLLDDTIKQIQSVGATVVHNEQTDQLLINGEYSASLVLSRCKPTVGGQLRWQIHFEQQQPPDITIAVLMDAANERPADFYLLPFMDINLPSLRLNESNAAPIETYHFESLDYFVGMAARAQVEVAA